MAIIVTRARGGSRDLLRKYRVLVDGVEVGRIGQGETVGYEAAAGDHVIQLKIDWGTSEVHRFTLGPDDTAYFACAPGGGAPLAAATGGVYIDLQQTSGPREAGDLPGPLRSQRPLGLAVAFCGGAALLVGGLIWYLTGLARPVGTIVTNVGLLTLIATMIIYRWGKRLADKDRRESGGE